MKYLMRGDANGRIALWKIPDTPECASMQLKKVCVYFFREINFHEKFFRENENHQFNMARNQFYFWKY